MALSAQWTPGQTGYVVTGEAPSTRWARIERLTSTRASFPAEQMRPNGRHADTEVVQAFGGDAPGSRHVLLHHGRRWEQAAGVPVVLVHGATVDAQYWHDPYGHAGRGLAPMLEREGRRVFAVSFAHKHGDNWLQAEMLAHAINRVRTLTGAEQVDVVAHSKGAVSARLLASNMVTLAPYRGDIRRLVLVGAPNLGLDYPFRHPLMNWGLFPEKPTINAPMSWARTRVGGVWVDTDAYSLYRNAGDFFPGQAQMLYRLDHLHALPSVEPDMRTTYHGGRGLVSVSRGIERAIAQGGFLIEKLREAPLDAAIELAVLAGSAANRPFFHNEYTGPSDGLVFVASATATDDMTASGAKLLAKAVLPFNHGELVYRTEAKRWLADVLQR
jgi:hypothetical protein